MYAWGGTCDSFTGLERGYQNQPVHVFKELNRKDLDYYSNTKNADDTILMIPRK